MVEIRIPPPEARRVAGQLVRVGQDLQAVSNDLSSSLSGLRGRWKGDAEAAYATGFETRVKRLTERVNLLGAIAAALSKIADAGEEADRAAKAVAPGG